MNEADFCKIPGMPHLFAVIDNVSNSEPNLVPGLFYTCMFDVSEDASVKVRYIRTEKSCRLVLLDGV